MLSMSTGQNHPLAHQSKFNYEMDVRFAASYEIRISGRYIGLLVNTGRTSTTQVTIWDWRQGTRVYVRPIIVCKSAQAEYRCLYSMMTAPLTLRLCSLATNMR